LCPSPSPRRSVPRVGRGVLPLPALGREPAGGQTGRARLSTLELVSHAAFPELHPTFGHPESQERLRVLHEAFPDFVSCEPATEDDILACHTRAYVELVRSIDDATWLDLDTVASAS